MPTVSPDWNAADWVAIIVAFFTVVVGPALTVALTTRLSRRVKSVKEATELVRESADATLYEMKNSHAKNFREEGDERHDEILTELGTLAKSVQVIGADVGTLKTDHSYLSNLISAQAARVSKLERSKPKPKKLGA